MPTSVAPPYAIRRNPATGRWIMYYRADRALVFRTASIRMKARYLIMGDADTLATALEGIYE